MLPLDSFLYLTSASQAVGDLLYCNSATWKCAMREGMLWFLPDWLVLKQQKQDEEAAILAEIFDTEVKAYRQLEQLQGEVVPTC